MFTIFRPTLAHTFPSLNMTLTNKPHLKINTENQNKTNTFLSERRKNTMLNSFLKSKFV